MSHQSGIQASPELASTFKYTVTSTDTNIRFIKVTIENEVLTCNTAVDAKGTYDQDFSLLPAYLHPTTPCFILYKLSESSSESVQFLLMTYVPDNARVREKMLYASTRASMTKELGDTYFTDAIYASTPVELSFQGYLKHTQHSRASAPLTQREQEMKKIKSQESGADIGVSTRRQHVSGVAFPMSDAACAVLQKFINSEYSVVMFCVDIDSETIEAVPNGHFEVKSDNEAIVTFLKKTASTTVPCYILSRWTHNQSVKILFIYLCPQQSAIKAKMLNASCKSTFLGYYVSQAGVEAEQKLEISDMNDLTMEHIQSATGWNTDVAVEESKQHGFIKKGVQGPGGGARRLIRK